MNLEENIIEEHLDEVYQNTDIDREFAKVRTQIDYLENFKLSVNYDMELENKLEKAINLLRLHVQNYQRIIIYNRRRARQRLRRRQCTLRNFFLQSLMEMQIRFVEMLPLAVEPRVVLENNFSGVSYNNDFECNNETENAKNLNFYHDVVAKYTNYQWLDTFHMSQLIFNLICSRLKTSLDNIDMDVESWIAMCIYVFATGSKFCSVATLFNVEKNFVRKSLYKFSECLLSEFSEKITMPNSAHDLENISEGFQDASNSMPGVCGVLSLFHVPNVCDCDRLDNCGSESIKVQVCIDDRLLFRKVEPTSHKPSMFMRSPNELSLNSKKISDDCVVPYYIVAPDNYPLRNWLMRKYTDPCESWEYNFNKSCGSLHIFREVSLKRLFGRWHILDIPECILPESKSFIVKACCLLHNILEENEEYFSLEWCKNFDPGKYEYKLTTGVKKFFNDSRSAIKSRNIIAKLMISNKE